MCIGCSICGRRATRQERCDEHFICDRCGVAGKILYYSRDGLLCGNCKNEAITRRIIEFEGDTTNTAKVTCPYCGYELPHGWYIEEGGKMTCHDCGNEFNYQRVYHTWK